MIYTILQLIDVMLDKIKEYIKKWPEIVIVLVEILIVIFLLSGIVLKINQRIDERSLFPYSLTVKHQENTLHLQQIKYNLVDEVEKYIQYIAPSSCLNALTVVEACDEYNIDIIFVLAQGQIESHYGTRGIAAKTNSVFNVHSFDGLSADQINKSGKGYRHPDFSVRPYLDLLQRKYLVDGKTERDMFSSFVDSSGNRYASDDNYEQSLMNTYLKISNKTKLDSLQQEYRKYKIITYL